MNMQGGVTTRVEQLRMLKEGWLEGSGKALEGKGLDWLEELFLRRYPGKLPLPRLYPTPEGNVCGEWSSERWDISLDICLATKRGEWHALDLETDDDETCEFGLDDDTDWARLVLRLREKLEIAV